MAALVTTCPLGHVFPLPIDSESVVQIVGCAAICPTCGAVAQIEDGIYVGAQLVAAAAWGASPESLRNVIAMLKMWRANQQASPQQVAESVIKEIPALETVLRLPETQNGWSRGDRLALAAVIVAVLSLLLQYQTAGGAAPNNQQIRECADKAVHSILADPNPTEAAGGGVCESPKEER